MLFNLFIRFLYYYDYCIIINKVGDSNFVEWIIILYVLKILYVFFLKMLILLSYDCLCFILRWMVNEKW